ncbi:MAG: hypothetical protein AAFR61_28995 [Bacteroidota bacterium]
MKTILSSLLLLLAFPTLLSAQTSSPHPLEGTWKMFRAQWGSSSEAPKETKQEIYKVFGQRHNFFIYYSEDKFSGAGGGTYTVEEGAFTETLSFFSWDSTAVGTAQTFEWTIQGDTLRQYGKLKGTDDYEDYVIDEYYVRVEGPMSTSKSPVAGIWQIEQATYGETTRSAEEGPWKINKLFTDSFWMGAFYDPKTGAFNGVGFGTYELEGNQYKETIKAYSWDQTMVGTQPVFTMEVKPEKLIQKGEINSEKYQNYKIEEYFRRVE